MVIFQRFVLFIFPNFFLIISSMERHNTSLHSTCENSKNYSNMITNSIHVHFLMVIFRSNNSQFEQQKINDKNTPAILFILCMIFRCYCCCYILLESITLSPSPMFVQKEKYLELLQYHNKSDKLFR